MCMYAGSCTNVLPTPYIAPYTSANTRYTNSNVCLSPYVLSEGVVLRLTVTKFAWVDFMRVEIKAKNPKCSSRGGAAEWVWELCGWLELCGPRAARQRERSHLRLHTVEVQSRLVSSRRHSGSYLNNSDSGLTLPTWRWGIFDVFDDKRWGSAYCA